MLTDDDLQAIEKRANLTDMGLRYIPTADVFALLSEVRSQQSSLRGASIWQTNMQTEIDRLREEVEMIKGVREVMDDATIAAVYLAQEQRIATLEADLAHARQWANRAINHPALDIGDEEDNQARAYCDVPDHFKASDEWFIGKSVPS